MTTVALFLVGMACAGLSNGRYATTVGPWVAVPLLLLFLDRAGARRGLALLLPGYALVHLVIWRGIIPAPGWIYVAVAAAYGVSFAMPFAIDAAAGPRLHRPWIGALVFPSAWVAVELLLARLTPYGSWGAIAYTQIDAPLVTQLASLFGTAGVAFFVAWTGSVIAWVAARWRARLPVPRWGWLSWALAAVAAVGYGEVRLRRTGEPAQSVRVALLAPAPELRQAFDREFWASLRSTDPVATVEYRLRLRAEAVIADLVERTRLEARAGARIVAWAEMAAKVVGADVDTFTQRMAAMAEQTGVYLAIGVGIWIPESTPPLRNAILAFEPDGRFAWSFDKAHPIVGRETSMVRAGDGILPAWETPYGRLTAAICHDFDFPPLLWQAGTLGAAAALAPSDDWRGIAWLHADMARLRAVENGVTLLRPAYGVSLVADPEGRVLVAGNTFDGAWTVVATVPLRRVRTVHAAIHDAFAWLCLAGLFVLVPVVRVRGAAAPGSSAHAA